MRFRVSSILSWRVGGLWGFVAPEFKRFNSNVITAKAREFVPKLHTELTKIGKTIYGEGVETNWCHRELSITTTCAGLMEDIKASWCRKYHHQASKQAGRQAGWQAGWQAIHIHWKRECQNIDDDTPHSRRRCCLLWQVVMMRVRRWHRSEKELAHWDHSNTLWQMIGNRGGLGNHSSGYICTDAIVRWV